MDFFIRKAARDWFRGIRREFSAFPGTRAAPDFDAFYFCFIAGIAKNRKETLPLEETAQLVPGFPEAYKSRGSLLVSLFLSRELRSRGVDPTERQRVHDVLSELVQPQAQNLLSDDGTREFNKYSFGGFDVLREWFDDRPTSLETFLRTYKRRIDESFATEEWEQEFGTVSISQDTGCYGPALNRRVQSTGVTAIRNRRRESRGSAETPEPSE